MTNTTSPQVTEEQNQDKAQKILNELSHYRIEPTKLKISDTREGNKGGQGVVTIRTLSLDLPAVVGVFVRRLREAIQRVKIAPEIFKRLLHKLGWELEDWPPELPVDVAGEMLRMSPETLNEWRPEMKVAVKMLEWDRNDRIESTKFFKSFVHELSLMTELRHPNIVQLVGFVEDMEKGDAWMILPWESNGNVREFLQSGEWDIPERLFLIQDAAKGLEYLHNRQPPICHGDLKSLNILVSSSYHAVITDFGSARTRPNVVSGERKNWSDLPCGTLVNDGRAEVTPPEVKFNPSTRELTLTGPGYSLRWSAPEVLAGEEQDLPSDMWAMGWICWEIVTGKYDSFLHGKIFVSPGWNAEGSIWTYLPYLTLSTSTLYTNPLSRYGNERLLSKEAVQGPAFKGPNQTDLPISVAGKTRRRRRFESKSVGLLTKLG